MDDMNLYDLNQTAEKVGMSPHTITTWYRWEHKDLKYGKVSENYLPVPIKLKGVQGTPRRWTDQMIAQLKVHKRKMSRGRNGIYGEYSNPLYRKKETTKHE